MKIKTSQEMLDSLVEKDTPWDQILKVFMDRADRYQGYYKRATERNTALKAEVRDLLTKQGRIKTVRVDRIVKDNWGSYVWYRNNKYRYNDDGLWVKHDQGVHVMATAREGVFMVNILIAEEDMPEVFVGECRGNIMGKKVILTDGHMINYGDKFEIRKLEEKRNG